MTYDLLRNAPSRLSRFSSIGETSSVQAGYAGRGKPLYDRGTILRNIKPYKTLNRYASPKGLRQLRRLANQGNYQRVENIAAKAVLQEAGIKRKGLRTQVDRKKFGAGAIQRGRAKLAQGYDIRNLGQTGLDINDIKNRRTRQAARQISTVRRNRGIMRTDPFAGKGYDIRMGHRPIPKPVTKPKGRVRRP